MLLPCSPQSGKGRQPSTAPIIWLTMYPVIVDVRILPRNQNARLTAGLIWAPLIFPTGDNETKQPTQPNKNPVNPVRIVSEGINFATEEPSPQLKITILKPK